MISILSKTFGIKSSNKYLLNNYKFLFSGFIQNDRRQYRPQQPYHNRYKGKRDVGINKKLFRTDQFNKKQINTNNSQDQTNVAELVKNINEINKEFLGIKVNTDYFKVYVEKKFQEAIKADKTQLYKVNDIPFALKSNNTQSKGQQVPTLNKNAAWKTINKMISEQKLIAQLKSLVQTYFSDILQGKRQCRMEPNFQVYSRKVIQTLKASKWSFKLTKSTSQPQINLTNVKILKGVKVNRNDNYTIDSYQINLDQQQQGIIRHTLWKKPKQQYPQSQWFAQRYIVARIQAQVSNAPVVQVTQASSTQSNNRDVSHRFVFEVDLTVPPGLSFLSLTQQQYLKSYRLKASNIQITNVDNKNIWFNIAYKEEQKKNKLINKLI